MFPAERGVLAASLGAPTVAHAERVQLPSWRVTVCAGMRAVRVARGCDDRCFSLHQVAE